jgi:hypothetical protein
LYLKQALSNGVLFRDLDADSIFNPWLERAGCVGEKSLSGYVEVGKDEAGGAGDVFPVEKKKKRDSLFTLKKKQSSGERDAPPLSAELLDSIVQARHTFLASLEARADTQGKFEWMWEALEGLKAK